MWVVLAFVSALCLGFYDISMLTVLKSVIVLSSWLCAYLALKHLPISIVSPWQATRPMWTLIGAMLIFGERLNPWQWTGVVLAIGSIFLFQLSSFDFRRSTFDSPPHCPHLCLPRYQR